MALNPPLLPGTQQPLPVHGETFILQRQGLRFEAEMEGSVRRKFDAHGSLYISTLRMVFVADPNTRVSSTIQATNWIAGLIGHAPDRAEPIDSFDLPLSLIRKERFNQPIFGCNNINGECSPLPGTEGLTSFKLSFYEGGVGTLLPIFFDLLNRNRHGTPAQPSGLDSAFQNAIESGAFMRSAFIDPNDPSQIFLTRPQPAHSVCVTREEYYRTGYQRVNTRDPDEGQPVQRTPVIIPTATAPQPVIIPTATAPVEMHDTGPSQAAQSDMGATPAVPEGWKVVSPEK